MKSSYLTIAATFALSIFSTANADSLQGSGTYHGLYSSDSSHQNSIGGITISILSTGNFSGHYESDGQRMAFRGVLNPDLTGVANRINTEKRVVYDTVTGISRVETFYRQLNFKLDPDENELNGTLTSDMDGALPVKAISKASAKDIKARGLDGKYTLRFSDGFIPGQGAFGNGCASLNVSSSGFIKMFGRFADGTPFSYGSSVSKAGNFPFHVKLNKGKVSALGWLAIFGSTESALVDSDVSGQIIWKNNFTTKAKGKNLFTAFELPLKADGSRYTPPKAGTPIASFSSPFIRLAAGDLRRPINREIVVDDSKISLKKKTNHFTVSTMPANGVIKGHFLHPDIATNRAFYGVVLQKQNVGAGFFLGVDSGGRMSLSELDKSSIGFDNPKSDIIGILPAQQENEPSIVILRDQDPNIKNRIVFYLADGSVAEVAGDSSDRLSKLTIDDHRFFFSNYTASTVTQTYHAPNGSVTNEIVPLSANSISMGFSKVKSMGTANIEVADAREENESVDALVDRTLNWCADITETHLILNTYKYLGQKSAELFDKVRSRVVSSVEKTVELASVVGNYLENFVENVKDLGRIVSEKAPVLMAELPRVDPDASSVAGFNISETGIKPKRDEWDRLARANKIDTDFTIPGISAEASVFAEMNPDSPRYIPPAPLKANHLVISTPANNSISGLLRGDSVDYFEVVSLPKSGKATIIDRVAGTFTYQPAQDYEGIDQFSFVAVNKTGKSMPALVTIEVGRGALAAHDLILETEIDTQISQRLGGSGAVSFEIVRQPNNGSLTLIDPSTGAFTYIPNTGYKGTDTFSFVAISERGRSDEAVVTIQVKGGPETANEWESILVGKWRVVDHPFLEKEYEGHPANEYRQNWTMEFTKPFKNSPGVQMKEKYEQVFPIWDGYKYTGVKINPVTESTFYDTIFGLPAFIEQEQWMLSYNKNPLNGNNHHLVRYTGGKLILRYYGQFDATLVKE